MVNLAITTGPAVEPLTLNEAKAHLRVDTTDDDTYIDTLITVARSWIEEMANLCLITQTVVEKYDRFPTNGGYFILSKGPVQSVSSIQYTDENGISRTWDPADYQTDLTMKPARIMPDYSLTYPTTRLDLAAVQVTYVAGYGDQAASVPKPIIQAMKLMIGEMYENRENNTQSAVASKQGVLEKLLHNYRIQQF